jgi:hypothetical protein
MSKTSKIFIEVLQNGEVIASTVKPYNARGKIRIGNKFGSELKLPFYALAKDIELFRTNKKGAELLLDGDWDGFISIKGTIRSIEFNHSSAESLILSDGDYGSIFWHDLQVLFRIGKEHASAEKFYKRHKAYRGKPLSLLIHSKIEGQILAASALAVALIFGPLVFLLNKIDLSHKIAFEELDPKYIAPFFDPKNIANSPEALQDSLNRSNYYKSTMRFYDSLTDMTLGWNNFGKNIMFGASVNLYQGLHQERADQLRQKIKKQQDIEARVLARPKTAVIDIPSVKGESVEGRILKLFDKIGILHNAFETNLEARRALTLAFVEDPEYEFGNYKKLKQSKKAMDALSKITPFHLLTNEQTMYAVAKDLAKKSERSRFLINKKRSDKTFLLASKHEIIGIPSGVEFASFLNEGSLLAEDEKINDLEASQYGDAALVATTGSSTEKGQPIKEPLIGEIEPNLIERIILKNKYELQLCYELALRRNQLTSGKMEWSWRIDTRGKISQLELVSSSIQDRSMVRCIREKIASWNFPRPRRGSVEVSYPFTFSKNRG